MELKKVLHREMCANGNCTVSYWDYETESEYPRAFGKCQKCGAVHLVILPRRGFAGAYWNSRKSVAEADALELSSTLLMDATQETLDRMTDARVGRLFARMPTSLPEDIGVRAESIAREKIRAELKTEFDRAKYAMIGADHARKFYEAELERFERRRVRSRVAKLQGSADRLTKYAKELTKSLSALEQSFRDGVREPVKAPDGYVKPNRAEHAVLCESYSTNEYLVYAMVDAADPECVRYIGLTNDPIKRYKAHHTNGHDRMMSWCASVADSGSHVQMVAVEINLTAKQAADREVHWIHHYRVRGQADLNNAIPKLRIA